MDEPSVATMTPWNTIAGKQMNIHIKKIMPGVLLIQLFILLFGCMNLAAAQGKSGKRVLYGQASYYANKFVGRKTASGEIFSQTKFTAACNTLPLGTWIKVTNMRNGQWAIVKINDRLHPKMGRIVDLTRAAAEKLGYVAAGLTRVKVEVLGKKPVL